MGDVADGIGELALGQGAAAPVGEAGGLVQVAAKQALHQHGIAHRLAEAADHGGDLRVEDRVGNDSRQMMNDLNVLPRRMKDLQHVLVDHEVEEWLEVDVRREAVDEHLGVMRSHLDEAQARPEGLLAHELGIDGDEGRRRELGAGCGEVLGTGNQIHGGRGIAQRLARGQERQRRKLTKMGKVYRTRRQTARLEMPAMARAGSDCSGPLARYARRKAGISARLNGSPRWSWDRRPPAWRVGRKQSPYWPADGGWPTTAASTRTTSTATVHASAGSRVLMGILVI